jgi:Sec7-like guanine-nucleotide exchange factor
MKVDNEFLEQLANNPGRIDKMSEEERKEILEFLRKDTDRRIEEERKGNGLFDQIKRYTDTLSVEERKRFYLDLNQRWARIAKEEMKRLNKIWKTKNNSI